MLVGYGQAEFQEHALHRTFRGGQGAVTRIARPAHVADQIGHGFAEQVKVIDISLRTERSQTDRGLFRRSPKWNISSSLIGIP